MIRNLLSNKFVFAAIVLAFALALGLNAALGSSSLPPAAAPGLLSSQANDPNIPDCSWLGCGSKMLAQANDPNIPDCSWLGCGSKTLAQANDPNIPDCSWLGCGSNRSLAMVG